MILHILHHIDPHHELADILDPPTNDGVPLMPFLLIMGIFVCLLVFGFFTAAIGGERHGGHFAWFLFGIFLAPILIPIALLIPISRKDHEDIQKATQAKSRAIMEGLARKSQQNNKP